MGSEGQFSLPSDYREQLQSSENQFADADLILASVEPADMYLLEEIISATSLTGNEKSILRYNYYYRNSDFNQARLNISQFIPANEDESDYKTLCLYDLDIIEHGYDFLSDGDFNNIDQIRQKGSVNLNFAISLLNNSPTYRDHPFDVVELPDVLAGSEIKQVDEGTNYLRIRPNPATDKVYIEFINYNLSENTFRLFDVSGKQVTNYALNPVSGGIELDISNLKEGFYFVSVTDEFSGMVRAGKLIKVRKSGQ